MCSSDRASWLDQLKQHFDSTGSASFWTLISNAMAALITVSLTVIAYLVYVITLVVFGFLLHAVLLCPLGAGTFGSGPVLAQHANGSCMAESMGPRLPAVTTTAASTRFSNR
jgi:hypothetical protein